MKRTGAAFLFFVYALSVPFVVVTKAIMIEQSKIAQEKSVIPIVTVTGQDPANIYVKIQSVLVAKTKVPLRWPTFLPYVTNKDPLYVGLLSADREGYNIELGTIEGCLGGNSCHYGTVRGSSIPLVENEGYRRSVVLEGGIKGYFIDFTCGAHCDDAALGWNENGYFYSISLKAGKKEMMIRMANSAIKH